MTINKLKCPRCKSSRLDKTLRGENFCRRCGQRWLTNGFLIPSFDKRSLAKDFTPKEDKQLNLLVSKH